MHQIQYILEVGSYSNWRIFLRIIALWSKAIDTVTSIAKSKHILYLVITSPSKGSWLFTVVYNG